MRKALVVGINNYPGAPLKGAVHDANAIASVLETHGDGSGSPNFNVRLLTAPSDTIGRAELRGAVEKVFDGDCEISLFYFPATG